MGSAPAIDAVGPSRSDFNVERKPHSKLTRAVLVMSLPKVESVNGSRALADIGREIPAGATL